MYIAMCSDDRSEAKAYHGTLSKHKAHHNIYPQSAMSVVWKDPCSCIYALIAVILNAPEGHASAITSKNFGITRQLKPI